MGSAVYYVPRGAPDNPRGGRGGSNLQRPELSHDEKTLYVNDTQGINIYAFDVQPDGRLANRRVFATYVGRDVSLPADAPPVSRADGLTTDDDGRLYALTDAGIEVLSPTGQHLGAIPVWCIDPGGRHERVEDGHVRGHAPPCCSVVPGAMRRDDRFDRRDRHDDGAQGGG